MKALFDRNIDAYVADRGFRKRDPAFSGASRHKPVYAYKEKPAGRFRPADFVLNPATGKLTCPAGNGLYVKDRNFKTASGFKAIAYMAKATDCRACSLRSQCLQKPEATRARQVYKFYGRDIQPESFTQRMIAKLDSALGRYIYSQRMRIIEPVFANIRHALGLDRFTLRGGIKVNIQWKLFAMVHNMLKIQRYGWVNGPPPAA